MQFDYWRAQADVATTDIVPMDLLILGKGRRGNGDKKFKRKGKGTGKGKGRDSTKMAEHFAGCCFGCKAWGHMKKG